MKQFKEENAIVLLKMHFKQNNLVTMCWREGKRQKMKSKKSMYVRVTFKACLKLLALYG